LVNFYRFRIFFVFRVLWLTWFFFPGYSFCQAGDHHDLHFKGIPKRWDEGIPLGNGMLGALIWQKDSVLRISLDRADLWDLRPVAEFSLPQFRFSWVREQWVKNTYDTVQKLFDIPYERDPGPTKIPAGALEIPLSGMGPVEYIHLYLKDALCEIKWISGARFQVFADAVHPAGRFRMEHAVKPFVLKIVPPGFHQNRDTIESSSVEGSDLRRLGYPAPAELANDSGWCYYHQFGYGNMNYAIGVSWEELSPGVVEGSWQVAQSNGAKDDVSFQAMSREISGISFGAALKDHKAWWSRFWQQSAVSLPDTLLERQYYRELYKFGSASRKGSPPITLQAVWTADNGRLPPWKGDFHNDLNTQLSYWPGYASNHLTESGVFTDWIWNNRDAARKYTEIYFQCPGLNFPGVSTLQGAPMGGWIQYALSPTVSAWFAQHFYLQWKYSLDTSFLIQKAYPFVRNAAFFLEQLSEKIGKYRRLPISSSPEINDNSSSAWFPQTTNFDLALIRGLYQVAREMSLSLNLPEDSKKWKLILSEWPQPEISDTYGLLIAPDVPYCHSHRHFSHLMAIYPLGLYDWQAGEKDRRVISRSLKTLKDIGTDYWCGYSFAWLGNLEARACNGDGAASALQTFASCFCLSNSFHANGDQSRTGKSKFTYRPFTLEGNFAFASGIQEMLMQSHHDIIRIFPAIPANWIDVSFMKLRARGAFLVSAVKKNGRITKVEIFSEKGGPVQLINPFGKDRIKMSGAKGGKIRGKDILQFLTLPGQVIKFELVEDQGEI